MQRGSALGAVVAIEKGSLESFGSLNGKFQRRHHDGRFAD